MAASVNAPDDVPKPSANGTKTLTPPPPPPQSPELVGKPTAKALASEYVSGSPGGISFQGQIISPQLAAYYESLPPWIDDIQVNFGMDITTQMALDPAIYTAMRTVVSQVLADGIDLRPAVDDKDDPLYAQSKDQAKLAEEYLASLPKSLEELSYEMLGGALTYGCRIAESVMRTEDSGQWVVGRVKPKPRRNVAFVVDPYMELAGFLPTVPGQFNAFSLFAASLVDAKKQNLVPKEHFVWLSWMPQDNDPRGSLFLRPLFKPWWQKQQLMIEYIKGLSQFGTPSLAMELGEDPFPAPPFDENGNQTTGEELSAADKAKNGLVVFRNGGVFVHSKGGKVYPIVVPGVGEQIQAELDRIDKQIEKAITLQTLATGEAKYGTKSLGEVHQDTAGAGLRYPRMILANMWNRLLRLVVQYNDGPKAARIVAPYVSLTATEHQDLAAELTAFATAYTAGVVVPPQRPKMWERWGLPDVPPEFLKQEAAQKQAAAQANIEATKAKAAPPGAATAKPKAAEFADDADGRWVTMEGQHVFIGKGGVIEKGPAHLVGKRPVDLPSREAPKKAPAVKGEMVAARREGKGKDAKIVMADGSPAPVHIKPSMVPPDWKDVKIGLDPDADVRVTGRDNKGRPKTVYRDDFHMRNAALKFARTQAGLHERHSLYEQNQANRQSPDPKIREAADCTWLMQEQATRPGSDNDTGGKVKAYGATTLRAEHVEESPEGVRLHFIGKEGVEHNHLIRDPELAKMLLERKRSADERDGKLFGTDYDKVSAYAKTLDTGRFTPKDWRTIKANTLALEAIDSQPPPASAKEYKAKVKAVAEKVSSVLGNRAQQALESYIDPVCFSGWKVVANA